MTIVKEDCRVTCTNFSSLRTALEAWKFSRPNETDPDIKQVIKIDAPVNEFPRITVAVRAPILVREIICSLRDHTVWARTSRVDDLNQWPLWLPSSKAETDHKEMIRLRDAGVHQDNFRMRLPLSYMTSFMVDLSLRSYVKLMRWFAFNSNRLDTTCATLFVEFATALSNALPAHIREAVKDAEYKIENICQRPYRDVEPGIYGSFVIVTAVVPIALRAQIVRHRLFQIADDLPLFFNEAGLNTPISDPMVIQLSVARETAEAISRKRQCWIAQTDLWAPIIAQFNLALGYSSEKPALPCEDGKCPYARDNDLRKEGRDPGPPCPRYANLYDERLLPEAATAATEYAKARPNEAYWLQQIGEAS